jgi:hypothetical protein
MTVKREASEIIVRCGRNEYLNLWLRAEIMPPWAVREIGHSMDSAPSHTRVIRKCDH